MSVLFISPKLFKDDGEGGDLAARQDAHKSRTVKLPLKDGELSGENLQLQLAHIRDR